MIKKISMKREENRMAGAYLNANNYRMRKNRQSAGSEWTGFDIELAETFAERIGVTLKLKEIGWNDKTRLLEKREIDCIRNGMTMTPVLTESISCSMPYLSNVQVVVMYEEKLKQYKTIEECQHLLFAVAAGSTGEASLKGKNTAM